MRPFTSESMRYEYDLSPASLVIDAGGYEGNWAAEMFRRYKCQMMIFEPVAAFYAQIAAKFSGKPEIGVIHGGLGGSDCGAGIDVEFHIQNDSTGRFAGSDKTETCHLYAASYVIGNLDRHVDLLKLNVEGSEYDILENLIDRGKMNHIRNLQIQFHGIPTLNPKARWKKIREALAETHVLDYADPSMEFQDNTWEGWRLK